MDNIIQVKSRYTRRELFEVWQTQGGNDAREKNKNLKDLIVSAFGYKSEEVVSSIVKNVSRFTSELAKRWSESYRNKDVFLKKNENWLIQEIIIYLEEDIAMPSTSTAPPGRPPVSFGEGSEKSKRRKTKDLVETFSMPELSYAAQVKLRKEG